MFFSSTQPFPPMLRPYTTGATTAPNLYIFSKHALCPPVPSRTRQRRPLRSLPYPMYTEYTTQGANPSRAALLHNSALYHPSLSSHAHTPSGRQWFQNVTSHQASPVSPFLFRIRQVRPPNGTSYAVRLVSSSMRQIIAASFHHGPTLPRPRLLPHAYNTRATTIPNST